MIAEKEFAGRQSQGWRKCQEDSYAFAEIGDAGRGELLLVIADGMGGYRAGDQASRLAVDTFIGAFLQGGGTCPERLAAGLNAANATIHAESRLDPDGREGMGTTLLAVVLGATGLEWVSVGDTALYLFRGSELSRLNADHSMRAVIANRVKKGQITHAAAQAHPEKTRLRSALTGTRVELVDWSERVFDIRPGDLLLAATDGLETLSRENLARCMRANRDKDACDIARALINAVRDADSPKQDNTTVAVVTYARRAAAADPVARDVAPPPSADGTPPVVNPLRPRLKPGDTRRPVNAT